MTPWKAVIVIVLILVLGPVVWLVGRGCGMAGYGLRQAERVVKKTADADNVIYNYEWFKQRAEDLDAADARINITKASLADFKTDMPKDRKEWTFEDKQEWSNLRTDLRGQEAHLVQLSADFRARSKMANRAIFKGNNRIVKWVDRLAGTQEQ